MGKKTQQRKRKNPKGVKTMNENVNENVNGSDILMSRLQSMKRPNESYALKSQEERTRREEMILVDEKKPGNGIRRIIELTLEPTKMGILGKKTRLNQDEYIDAIQRIITEESDSWEELRMKDQIRLTRDYIVADTIIKHCIDNKLITDISESMKKNYSLSYATRADEKGSMIGEAITVILTELEGIGYE